MYVVLSSRSRTNQILTKLAFLSVLTVLWSCKRGPTMDCPSIPHFYLNFLLRSKIYLKDRPPSASIANRGLPLSSKPEHVVRLVYTHYKGANYAAAQWFTLVQGA